jgi:hypothetical protein
MGQKVSLVGRAVLFCYAEAVLGGAAVDVLERPRNFLKKVSYKDHISHLTLHPSRRIESEHDRFRSRTHDLAVSRRMIPAHASRAMDGGCHTL